MTVQETAVLEELETVAENGSVPPSNTLPEVGLTEMVMLACGEVVLPLPPPPQAARDTLRARRGKIQSAR